MKLSSNIRGPSTALLAECDLKTYQKLQFDLVEASEIVYQEGEQIPLDLLVK